MIHNVCQLTNDTTVARVKARQGKKISGISGRSPKRTHGVAWETIAKTQTSILKMERLIGKLCFVDHQIQNFFVNLIGRPFVTPWRSIWAGRSPMSIKANHSNPKIDKTCPQFDAMVTGQGRRIAKNAWNCESEKSIELITCQKQEMKTVTGKWEQPCLEQERTTAAKSSNEQRAAIGASKWMGATPTMLKSEGRCCGLDEEHQSIVQPWLSRGWEWAGCSPASQASLGIPHNATQYIHTFSLAPANQCSRVKTRRHQKVWISSNHSRSNRSYALNLLL